MNANIDPAVAVLNVREDEFTQQINSITNSGCDIFNRTNAKLMELNIKRHHDLSALRIQVNEADQCIYQRSHRPCFLRSAQREGNYSNMFKV